MKRVMKKVTVMAVALALLLLSAGQAAAIDLAGKKVFQWNEFPDLVRQEDHILWYKDGPYQPAVELSYEEVIYDHGNGEITWYDTVTQEWITSRADPGDYDTSWIVVNFDEDEDEIWYDYSAAMTWRLGGYRLNYGPEGFGDYGYVWSMDEAERARKLLRDTPKYDALDFRISSDLGALPLDKIVRNINNYEYPYEDYRSRRITRIQDDLTLLQIHQLFHDEEMTSRLGQNYLRYIAKEYDELVLARELTYRVEILGYEESYAAKGIKVELEQVDQNTLNFHKEKVVNWIAQYGLNPEPSPQLLAIFAERHAKPAAAPATAPASTAITVLLNGKPVQFDQPPIIEDGRTLVPLRAIFEAMGAGVDWNASTRTVVAAKDGVVVTLTIGSHTLNRNGRGVELDVAAKIEGGRTLVPARAVAESFNADVDWNAATRTVIIQY